MNTWPYGTFLASLDPADRKALLGAGSAVCYAPNETIMLQGADGIEVVLLLRGFAKIVGTSHDGSLVLLAFRTRGDAVGELAALDGGSRSATVQSATAVEARRIAATVFTGLLDSHPGIGRALRVYVARKLRSATGHRIDVSSAPVLVGVARVLDRLVGEYGRPEDGGITLDIPLSQAEVAALVGASQPSVQRALADLRRRGVIMTGYRRPRIMDPDLLGRIAKTHT